MRAQDAQDARVPPLWRNVVLLVGFLLLVVAGVFTVVLPELEEDSAESEGAEPRAGEPTDGEGEPPAAP